MRPRLALRALAAPCLALALLAAGAPAAFGHASFLGSDPAPGQRLQSAPAHITLLFSETLNRDLSRATLVDAATGRHLAARRRVQGRRLILTPAARLGRAPYRVEWDSVSTQDGHPLEGSFGFGVRVAAAGGGSVERSPLARNGWLRAAARAVLYAALLLFAGGVFSVALLGGTRWLTPPEAAAALREHGLEDPGARVRSLITDAGIFAAGLAALVAVVEAASAAGRLSAGALRDYLLASPSSAARIALVGLLALAAAVWRARPRAGALGAAAAIACVVYSGHANSADPRALAALADLTHLLAAAVWLGGAATIVLVWGPALRRGGADARAAVARHVLPAFGRVALPAFGVVVVAGTVNAAVELGRISALWDTTYGVVLLAKIALVIAIAAVAWTHSQRLRPRLLSSNPHPSPATERAHWRLLRAEPLMALGVAAAAGLLVAFPLPPRQADATGGAAAALPGCNPCPLPAPRADELAVAEQGGSRVVAAWIRRRPGEVEGTVRLLDYRARAAPGPVRVNDLPTTGCGSGCFRFRVPGRPAELRVAVAEGGRASVARLPAHWRPGSAAAARRLLERAERTMRALRSVREDERVTSGPGTEAVTHYALRAPDRLEFVTARGVHTIQIGGRQWQRIGAGPWLASPIPGRLPFSTRSWFRWTPYAQAVALLGERSVGGRRVADLALMDPGTPVWLRLAVDVSSGRVLTERLVTPARFIATRFLAFDAPLEIRPPRTATP